TSHSPTPAATATPLAASTMPLPRRPWPALCAAVPKRATDPMPWNLADAARRYEAGESLAHIAQALDTPESTVYRRLLAGGLPPRGRPPARSPQLRARTGPPRRHRPREAARALRPPGRTTPPAPLRPRRLGRDPDLPAQEPPAHAAQRRPALPPPDPPLAPHP